MNNRLLIILIIVVISISILIITLFYSLDYKDIVYSNNYLNKNNQLNEETIKLIKTNSEIILLMANEYGVNPIAIAGIIATENNLNSSPHKSLKESFIKNMVSKMSETELQEMLFINETNLKDNLGKPKNLCFKANNKLTWSLGICQVSIIRAIALEQKLCEIECRKPKLISDVITSLLDPSDNIKYCSLELSLIQSYYQNTLNIDIKDNPEILATAYNIGLENVIVKYHINTDKIPTTNSFGRFVFYNKRLLINILLEHLKNKTATNRKQPIDQESLINL